MYYLLLKESRWQVIVPCDAFGNCGITFEGNGNVRLDGEDLSSKDEDTRRRILATLDRLAQHGDRAFNSSKSHIVDEKERIFSVQVGSYRILHCFEAGKVVICCHVFRKRSQKIPRSAKRAAAKIRTEYQGAAKSGTLKILKP